MNLATLVQGSSIAADERNLGEYRIGHSVPGSAVPGHDQQRAEPTFCG
jgi:hypothetical protein